MRLVRVVAHVCHQIQHFDRNICLMFRRNNTVFGHKNPLTYLVNMRQYARINLLPKLMVPAAKSHLASFLTSQSLPRPQEELVDG